MFDLRIAHQWMATRGRIAIFVAACALLTGSEWTSFSAASVQAASTPGSPAGQGVNGKANHSLAGAASDSPIAIIHTTAGDMHCTLFPKVAPVGVANFIGLSQGTKAWVDSVARKWKFHVPLYDGTIFHRVVPGLMIEGGDPLGTGKGKPGYVFRPEISRDLAFDRPGRLAYANDKPGLPNGSQFFITEAPITGKDAESYNGHYVIFGQCDDEAVAVVKKIAEMPRDPSNDRPLDPVKVKHIEIQQPSDADKSANNQPEPKSPEARN
jgi:peptidyl-prolyl cis-trans isomerase A (cyclophilin A)